MPVAVNQSATNFQLGAGGSGNTYSVSFDAGTGADRLLVVAIRESNGGDITLVKYAGVDCTYVGEISGLEVWRLPAHATGANNLTWTSGTTFNRCFYSVASFTGANQTPTSSLTTNTGNTAGGGTRTTGSITCPTDGLVWAALHEQYTNANITGTGLLNQVRDGNDRGQGHSTRSSTGAIDWSSANLAFNWWAVGLPIEAAGGTPPSLSTTTTASVTGTGATVGVTTDAATGTLYVSVTTSATQPSIAQIKAGQNEGGSAAPYASSQAISSTGAKTFNATGLTSGLTYYAHFIHNNDGGDSNRITSAAIYPGTWRPTSDVTVTGWTLTGAASHAAAVNENTASDSEFSTSGALTSTPTVKILALDRSLPAGTYTVKVRPKLSAGSGFVRISLLNDSNTAQGTSADTAITSTFTTYAITVTTTGAATRIREEYWI